MAPSPVDYPILISQLPFASKLAAAEQTHPAIRQELFGPLLLQEQRKKNKEEVPAVNAKEPTSTVSRDGAGNAPNQMAQEKDKHETKPDAEEEPETNPSSGSPWTGNIINKKI